MDKLENLGVPEVELLINNVANLYVGSDTGISRIVSESNASNDSDKVLLLVFPRHLFVLPHSDL